ncbi:MAG: hypothetical protein LBM38_01495 [Clostridiales bacterium]|jgi:hypothetical protein|nr:hypothetical protein [Clostridiales bacterium]
MWIFKTFIVGILLIALALGILLALMLPLWLLAFIETILLITLGFLLVGK